MKRAKSSALHHAQTSLGVQTRAKTKKFSSPSDIRFSTIVDDPTVEKGGGDGCYLQLRSRRLERRAPSLTKKAKKVKVSRRENEKKDEKEEVDVVNKERIIRESTPDNLVVGSDIIKSTLMSSNKARTTNVKKLQIVVPTLMPSAQELEEFLAQAEKQRIEQFIKQYNFDPVNEKPLEGRYEWEEIKP